jgi:hypothetical protein
VRLLATYHLGTSRSAYSPSLPDANLSGPRTLGLPLLRPKKTCWAKGSREVGRLGLPGWGKRLGVRPKSWWINLLRVLRPPSFVNRPRSPRQPEREGVGQAARAISTARLSGSHRLHLPPIDVVISHGPSELLAELGVLILGGASHLDAFSGYPFPTSLPGDAPGGTAGTRVVSPSRSSRTRDGSPQHSNARDGYRPNCLTTF